MAAVRRAADSTAQRITREGSPSVAESFRVVPGYSSINTTSSAAPEYRLKDNASTRGVIHLGSNSTRGDARSRKPFPGKWYQFRDRIFWNIQQGDIDVLKNEIRFVPLRFKTSEIENEFYMSFVPTYRMRCVLVGIAAISSFAYIIPVYLILGRSTIISITPKIRDLITACILLTAVFFITIGFIPWLPYAKTRPEAFAVLCLGLAWSFGTVLNCVLSVGINYSTDPLNGTQLNIWRDVGSAALWIWGIVIMDCIFKTRTRTTILPHIILASLIICPIGIEIGNSVYRDSDLFLVGFHIVMLRVLAILHIVFAVPLITLGYIARYHAEFEERVEFLRIRCILIQLQQLVEKKQGSRKGGVTVVEEVTNLVTQASSFVRGISLETGNVNLTAAEQMLAECLDTLANTTELFAVRFETPETGTETDNVQAQFYNLYANKRAKPRHVDAATTGTGCLSIQSGAAGHPRGDHNFRVNFSLPDASLLSHLDSSDPTIPVLKKNLGISNTLNLFALSDKSPSLFVNVGAILLSSYVDVLGGTPHSVFKFLSKAQDMYLPNPYHNACHGATVAHVANCLARSLSLFQGIHAQGWEIPILTISALCHDAGHPGRNNAFFINSHHQLAIIFNDSMVLENFHSFLTFSLLNRDETNLLERFTYEETRNIRQRIIELILATDMAQHFETISRFRLRRQAGDFSYEEDVEDMWRVAQLCVKTADLSHGLVDWKQHIQWSCRITEEFYQQGDEELSLSVPVSPLCARSSHADFAKSQKGFLEFVIQPLLQELEAVDMNDIIGTEWTRSLVYNKFRWEELSKDSEPPEISEDIRSTKTMTKDPFLTLCATFLEVSNLHSLSETIPVADANVRITNTPKNQEPQPIN